MSTGTGNIVMRCSKAVRRATQASSHRNVTKTSSPPRSEGWFCQIAIELQKIISFPEPGTR
jgi:hypothetical protein